MLNYVAAFCLPWPKGLEHPLRVVPPDTGKLKNQLPWGADNDRVTAFRFGGDDGFIQPLADTNKRVNDLKSGRQRRAPTAVMIGKVGSNGVSWPELIKWFPFNALRLLSLASACEVGAAWIEFRAHDGSLVHRWHTPLGRPSYLQGSQVIDECIHGGTGNLLTRAFQSAHFQSPHVQVALQNLVTIATRDLSLDDEFSHLSRAMDALCDEYGLRRFPSSLEPRVLGSVKQILLAAKNKLLALADSEQSRGELEKIGRAVEGALEISRTFGESLLALLAHFRFHDASVVGAHYDPKNPTLGVRKWCQGIATLRNTVAHGGYIDLEKKPIADVVRLRLHLWDILLRATLSALDYEGQYNSPVCPGLTSMGLGWVTPSTAADALGYSEAMDRWRFGR